MAKLGDVAFWAWATSQKECTYCHNDFVGPVCPCEYQQRPPAFDPSHRDAYPPPPQRKKP